MEDHYAILEVSRTATAGVIKQSFRQLALLRHPDKTTGSTVAFQKLNLAYEILSDASKRATYDALLNSSNRNSTTNTAKPSVPRHGKSSWTWSTPGYHTKRPKPSNHQSSSYATGQFNSQQSHQQSNQKPGNHSHQPPPHHFGGRSKSQQSHQQSNQTPENHSYQRPNHQFGGQSDQKTSQKFWEPFQQQTPCPDPGSAFPYECGAPPPPRPQYSQPVPPSYAHSVPSPYTPSAPPSFWQSAPPQYRYSQPVPRVLPPIPKWEPADSPKTPKSEVAFFRNDGWRYNHDLKTWVYGSWNCPNPHSPRYNEHLRNSHSYPAEAPLARSWDLWDYKQWLESRVPTRRYLKYVVNMFRSEARSRHFKRIASQNFAVTFHDFNTSMWLREADRLVTFQWECSSEERYQALSELHHSIASAQEKHQAYLKGVRGKVRRDRFMTAEIGNYLLGVCGKTGVGDSMEFFQPAGRFEEVYFHWRQMKEVFEREQGDMPMLNNDDVLEKYECWVEGKDAMAFVDWAVV